MKIKKRQAVVFVAVAAAWVCLVVTMRQHSIRPIASLGGHTGPVYAIAFSPDGGALASSDGDGVIRLWDLKALRVERAVKCFDASISLIAFSADGSTLALREAMAGGADVCQLLDLPSLRSRAVIPYSEAPTWAKRDGAHVGAWRITTDDQIFPRKLIISDQVTGHELRVIDGHPDQLNDWVFTPHAEIVITAGGYTDHPWPVNRSGDARLWDVKTGRLLAKLESIRGAVVTLALSTDGDRLATGGSEGTIQLWDIAAFRRNRQAGRAW